MFERSLYAEGFKLLQKIQNVAEDAGEYNIQLWAARLELHYINYLNFYIITESELVQKQMKIQSLLKYANNIHQHTSLYELLRHRLLYKGSVRTEQQKTELNDLLVSELNLISRPVAETFENYKIHLLFQAHYFLTISDYKSALKAFYELNDLFDQHNYIEAGFLEDYLTTIEGILDSLHTIRHYHEMEFFIEKLLHLKNESDYYEALTQRLVFIYKITGFLYRAEFNEAMLFKEGFKDTFLKKIHLLDISKQAEVHLYTALIYIGLNNMNKAHYYLNRILMESKLYRSLPIFRTFRLIHLLVHYELGNHDYIKYETRSILRGLNEGPKKAYLLEKIVLKFIQHTSLSGTKAKLAMWEKIRNEFKEISSDKYETQILKIFDFSTWIEAKLCKKSFALLLKERCADTEVSTT
jgi:hypothetical protein